MAENLERVQLEDQITEEIAGGMIHVISNPVEGRHIWGDSNPDVSYTFTKTLKVMNEVSAWSNKDDDAGLIQHLISKGLIWPE